MAHPHHRQQLDVAKGRAIIGRSDNLPEHRADFILRARLRLHGVLAGVVMASGSAPGVCRVPRLVRCRPTRRSCREQDWWLACLLFEIAWGSLHGGRCQLHALRCHAVREYGPGEEGAWANTSTT